MPREDRRIYFDYSETYKAIYALSVQKEMKKPPPGTVTSVAPHPEDSTKFAVKIENNLKHESYDMDYGRDFIAAALMLYCRGLGIPLPKQAQKSVELDFGSITLRIQI